jgi:type IX secretion system PorP/SprF family membrane protein
LSHKFKYYTRNIIQMKIRLLKTLVCFFALTISLNVNAQQDPIFTQYLMNPLAYNPAYAGTYDMLNVTAMSRLQNPGSLTASNITNAIAIHSSFPSTDVMGLGIYMVNHKYSFVNSTDLTMAYSYKIKINDYTRLSFGLQSTYVNNNYNYSKLDFTADQINNGDQNYNTNRVSSSKLNFGGGMYLLNQEKFFASISVPKILADNYSPERNGITAQQYKPTLYVSGGVILGGKGNLPIRPSFLLRTAKGAPSSLDLSTSVLLSKIIWLGASVRNFQILAVIGQIDISEHLRIAYSLDIPVASFHNKNLMLLQNPNEISVNVNMAAFKKQTVIPRFF